MKKNSSAKKLFVVLIALLFWMLIPLQTVQAKPAKAPKPAQPVVEEKESVVLMPLHLFGADKAMQASMEAAIVDGLQNKYTVVSGEVVANGVKEIYQKESAKKDCDASRCLVEISVKFKVGLIAIAEVNKIEGGYLTALSIRDVYTNEVKSKQLTCEGCSPFKVVDKLKELSSLFAPAAPTAPVVASTTTSVPSVPVATVIIPKATDTESVQWVEVQKGNSVEDYEAYLAQYPKGKYAILAKGKIKKLKEQQALAAQQQQAQAAAEQAQQDQSAWEAANTTATQASYQNYLNNYPQGSYANLANARLSKLKKEEADLEAKQRREQLAAEAKQKREAAEAEKNAAQSPVMVRIPGKNFEMGKYLVTKGEFAKFVLDTGYDAGNSCNVMVNGEWQNRFSWRNPGFNQEDSNPVTCVSWESAQAYVSWLSKKTNRQYRLPTEAEWEYACSAGDQTQYCGSNDINAVAWYSGNSGNKTHPVGQKQANGYGLYDMSGNVWEWMQDWYDDGQTMRSSRGGSWSSTLTTITPSFRNGSNSTLRDNFGFRLVR